MVELSKSYSPTRHTITVRGLLDCMLMRVFLASFVLFCVTGLCLFLLLLSLMIGHEVSAQSKTEPANLSATDRPVVRQWVQYPHSNGYQLGDQFEHKLVVEIRQPYVLVSDSLPSKGRVSEHIELQDIAIDKSARFGTTAYEISLQYQVINYSDSLVGTSVPPVLVSFATDSDVYPVVIEPWGFTISPFLMKEARNYGAMPSLQELDRKTGIPVLARSIICSLLLFTGIAFLLPVIRNTLISSIRRSRNQPFIRAHRCIRKIPKYEPKKAFERSLYCLHEAFNNKFGRTVLSEDLDLFLAKYDEYAGSRADIGRFFRLSDEHFFGHGDSPPEEIKKNITFVRSLSDALRRKERVTGNIIKSRFRAVSPDTDKSLIVGQTADAKR